MTIQVAHPVWPDGTPKVAFAAALRILPSFLIFMELTLEQVLQIPAKLQIASFAKQTTLSAQGATLELDGI